MVTIKTKEELHDFIEADKKIYLRDTLTKRMTDIFLGREEYHIYKFPKFRSTLV